MSNDAVWMALLKKYILLLEEEMVHWMKKCQTDTYCTVGDQVRSGLYVKYLIMCCDLSPAYILATMPVYDPTELSRANRVATVQRSLRRLNHVHCHDPINT